MKIRLRAFGELRHRLSAKNGPHEWPAEINLEEGRAWTLRDFINTNEVLRDAMLTTGGQVKPATVILVNDVDHALIDGLDCLLKQEDEITVMPTIHGGHHGASQ